MARNIKFVNGDRTWESGINKVDRDKVYGWVETVILDQKGRPCTVASMLDDGSTLILSGTTSLKILTPSGSEISRKDLEAVHEDGSTPTLIPSVFERDIELNDATMEEFLDLEVKSIYQLSFDTAEQKASMLADFPAGKLMKFEFNYRSDYTCDDAMVLSAQNEVFVLTGTTVQFPYLSNVNIANADEAGNDDAEDDDFDFGLL